MTTLATTLATPPTCAFPAQPPARRGFRWHWFLYTLGGLASLAAVFLIALILSFRMGGEARALRHAVFTAAPGAWQTEFEFGVGRLPAFLARTGFRLADWKLDLPPEAAAGISAFRSADVGIYHRSNSADPASQSQTLNDVDAAMSARNWEPLVSVQEKGESVRIFVPKDLSDLHDTRACVFVMERDQLVMVSARVDLEPLIAIAASKVPRLHLH